jgi:hypothetical protein
MSFLPFLLQSCFLFGGQFFGGPKIWNFGKIFFTHKDPKKRKPRRWQVARTPGLHRALRHLLGGRDNP